jgi:hypothetical protein
MGLVDGIDLFSLSVPPAMKDGHQPCSLLVLLSTSAQQNLPIPLRQSFFLTSWHAFMRKAIQGRVTTQSHPAELLSSFPMAKSFSFPLPLQILKVCVLTHPVSLLSQA